MTRKSRIRNAYTKAIGKEWYRKMLAAKLAKADKAKREKLGLLDSNSKVKPNLPPSSPKEKGERLEVTEPTHSSKMEENTSSSNAIEQALRKLENQARGL